MPARNLLAALLFASACASSPAPGPDHEISWSSGTSDSPGVPDPVICGELVSHPCPWLLFTHTLVVDGQEGTVTWTDASGGTNDIGVPASNYADVVESVPPATSSSLLEARAISLPLRGDDGGLRHALTLQPTKDGGWEADVTWTLFNVAGNTTFHLTVAP